MSQSQPQPQPRARAEPEVERARARDPFHEGAPAARARKLRSAAIAVGLVAFVLLIFAVTLLKMSAAAHPHG